MAKARKKGLAALLASLFALVLAAFLCMGMPARDAHAQDETQYNVGGDGIDTPEELLLAYAGLQSGGGTIELSGNILVNLDELNFELPEYVPEDAKPDGHFNMPYDAVIDLNGHTLQVVGGLSQDADQGVAVCAFNIGQNRVNGELTNSPADITIRGGNLIGVSYGHFAIVRNGSSLTLEDVNVQFEYKAAGVAVDASAAIAAVNGATVSVSNVSFTLTNAVPMMEVMDGGPSGTGERVAPVFAADSALVKLRDQIALSSESLPITAELSEDVDGSLVIPEYAQVTLDLGGHTITNTANEHTITNFGTLTIVDGSPNKTGAVDNISHGRGALVNYGTATLSGGTFTRSRENGTFGDGVSASQGGTYSANGNSWYTLKNYGDLTIEDGTTVTTRLDAEVDGIPVGGYSSLVANGYQSPSDRTNNYDLVTTEDKVPALTITGGSFSGGLITIKNDE